MAQLEFSGNESNLINYFFLVNFFLFVVIFPLLTGFIFYLLNHTLYLNTLLEKIESNQKNPDIANIPNIPNTISPQLDSAQVATAEMVETLFKTEKKISRIKITWLWISRRLKQGLDNGFQLSIQMAVSMAITYCTMETGKYLYSKIGLISTGTNFIYSTVYDVAAWIRETELCNAFVESIGDCIFPVKKLVP